MTIETKFDVYDEIFFIVNKKSCKMKVRGIKIQVTSCPEEIFYDVLYLCGGDEPDEKVFVKVEEEHAYGSKEKLLESI